MNDYFLTYPYPSKRVCSIAKKGMVATSQPLAAQAGMEILKMGGNAVDAAIATAACLTVVEPSSNGIGGDAFALVWMNNSLYGLNASGTAPMETTVDYVKSEGYDSIPERGFIPVTVPGAPSAWAALSKRFGKLSLKEVLKPAINYAREGFPLSPTGGRNWRNGVNKLKEMLKGEEYGAFFDTFAPNGKIPKIGEIWKSENFATTLESIAETNAESFYRGELADKIDAFSKKYGGKIRKEDLANFYPEWVTPISTHYKGYDIWEIPPNGQGIVVLMALNMLKAYKFHEKEQIHTYHTQLEAMKLAFTDGKAFVTEAEDMRVKVDELLSEEYANERKKLITDIARPPKAGKPEHSGTVYMATADEEGNMVSFIQSNYRDFGSGLVVPETGILLQNRGHNFSLDPEHVNCLKPGKRTYHTIIPGFITKGNTPIGPFGVIGAFMQPQGQVQVLMNMIEFGLNPQAAIDAPRWQWFGDNRIMLETNVPRHIIEGLGRKGHEISMSIDSNEFGRAQIIWRDPDTGVYYGGTESRTDGSVAVW
ncbi:gamma-glutamyltransferase [Niallia nealsonii]|uniref:Glutathione hydrolase proenzyme n=1 Tax=Niallia nealsonii TaxID=115979 RepID=A0A2N0Z1V6_9BACI|nr:gamma-glutamyltransferase [Niallia nealsonii]PKG23477.1 gamma-glutamyltransferase [Niallia nealsonii]